ncbi:MAG: hypothetical protein JSS50_04615 [Proteobacteria bacterium]|nr:hypothetical protein [Pseudomonadota bacterium]
MQNRIKVKVLFEKPSMDSLPGTLEDSGYIQSFDSFTTVGEVASVLFAEATWLVEQKFGAGRYNVEQCRVKLGQFALQDEHKLGDCGVGVVGDNAVIVAEVSLSHVIENTMSAPRIGNGGFIPAAQQPSRIEQFMTTSTIAAQTVSVNLSEVAGNVKQGAQGAYKYLFGQQANATVAMYSDGSTETIAEAPEPSRFEQAISTVQQQVTLGLQQLFSQNQSTGNGRGQTS